jgi:RNA polymerase sigma-70 factor (sigma-E family)
MHPTRLRTDTSKGDDASWDRMPSAHASVTGAGMESLPESETQLTDRLGDLYARHVPATIGFAYLLTGSRAEAEDLVHEAFVRVVGRLQYLRRPDAFDAYLLRTVVNLHMSRLRRLRVERRYLAREGIRSSDAVAPYDLGERDRIWSALDRLPRRQRAAVVLRYAEDRSERETADLLRCSVHAVKSLTARALDTLRAELRGDEG